MMEYVGHYSDTFYIASSITCNHVAKTHNLYLEGHHIWIKTCKTFWHFVKNMPLQIDMQQIVCPHGLCPCGYSRFGGIFPPYLFFLWLALLSFFSHFILL
jgi:disulfide bond formation protein DsbB